MKVKKLIYPILLTLPFSFSYAQEPQIYRNSLNPAIDIPAIMQGQYPVSRELILVARGTPAVSHAKDFDIDADRRYGYRVNRISANFLGATPLIFAFSLEGAVLTCNGDLDESPDSFETLLNCQTGEPIRPQQQSPSPERPSGEEL